MLAHGAGLTQRANPWAFEAHPEVWLLVGGIVALSLYAVRRIGPLVVAPGQPVVTVAQKRAFIAGIGLLWLAADWPIHDLAENYLYSVHMFQHLIIAFIVPPLLLLAMPEWLARLLFFEGGLSSKVLRFLTKPVVAALLFNAFQLLTHWGGVVKLSTENGPFHYSIHLGVFFTALLMWFAVLGPLKELHLSEPAKMLYLFAMSIISTVPAGWLAMADKVVYPSYENDARVLGLSPTTDQQLAGAIMKVLSGFYLWTLIAIRFFRFTGGRRDADIAARQARRLTYEDVERAFDESEPAPREQQTH